MADPTYDRERHNTEKEDDTDGEDQVEREVDRVQDSSVEVLIPRTDRSTAGNGNRDQLAA